MNDELDTSTVQAVQMRKKNFFREAGLRFIGGFGGHVFAGVFVALSFPVLFQYCRTAEAAGRFVVIRG